MADDTNPTHPSSSPSESAPAPSPATRRPVYEPSLLPSRRRRRVSRWIVLPALLIPLLAVLYFFLVAPHHRRFVSTVGRIVFASDQGAPGHSHLWLAEITGQNAKRLTDGGEEERAPEFSPDGSQITYLATANGNPQIFVVDADGKNSQQITRNSGAKQQPTIAPSDNTLIGFASGGVLSTVNAETADSSRLLPPASGTTHPQSSDALINSAAVTIDSYAWTPAKNGTPQGVAAVEEVGDVRALVVLPALDGKPRDTQTDQPGSPPLAAADAITLGWSPSGNLLAAALLGVKGLPSGRALSAIVLFDSQGNSAGQHPLAVSTSGTLGPQNPVFSPDGTQIAFELWQQPDLAHARSVGLFTVATGGEVPPRPLVRGDAEAVRWTPDGNGLLFLRRRPDSGHDLYHVDADGRNLIRISDGTADITGFAVSPQGRNSL